MSEQKQNLEERLYAVARAVEPDEEFTAGLWKRIAQIPRRETNRQPRRPVSLRPVWGAVAFLLFLGLAFVLIAPQNIATAFEALVRYLPGIGFVQDEPSTLYVAGPQRFEQGGATLVVDGAVADAQITVVSYHIEGLPEPRDTSETVCFYDVNRLRLPDGKEMLPTGGGAQGYEARVEFWPLPAGVKEATLYVAVSENSMLDPGAVCAGPTSFTVDLHFGARPADLTPLPVFEAGAQSEETDPSGVLPPTDAAQDPGQSVPNADGIAFRIDKVVPLQNELLVVGRVDWDNPLWRNVRIDAADLQVRDVDGNVIQATPDEAGGKDNLFAFRLAGARFAGPLTFTISSVRVLAVFEDGPVFDFEAGEAPEAGRTWEVNRELEALGQTLRVLNVRAVHDESGQAANLPVNGFALTVEKPSGVDDIDFFCTDQRSEGISQGIWGQGFRNEDGTYTQEVYFSEYMPAGRVTCKLSMFFYHYAGPWELTWQPPELTP